MRSPRGSGPSADFGLAAFAKSVIDPRAWSQLLRLIHYYNYSHVKPRRRMALGPGVRIAPNVSFANAERIEIGAGAHVGARCSLWAGNSRGRILIGDHALLGPDVFITASDYQFEPGTPIVDQPKNERDVVVGRGTWLGARVIVVAGVHIGDGCVIGAGSVVTRSLPADTIAVGNPARVIGKRAPGVSLPSDGPRKPADTTQPEGLGGLMSS